LPILQQYGFKAHFFITTGWIGTPYFLTPEQIKALHEAGMGIGSHGVTHRFLSDLPDNEAVSELTESRERLSAIVGSSVTSFSAPGGRITQSVIDVAQRCGCLTICNSEPDLSRKGMQFIPRIALTGNCSMQTFTRIADADIAYFRKQRIKNTLLSAAKKTLGNERYVAVRKLLLKAGTQ